MRLHRISSGKIGGKRPARHIHIPVRVESNAVCSLAGRRVDSVAAAEIGRPDQLRAIRIKFRDESFLGVKVLTGLIRVLRWEKLGVSPSYRVGIAIGVRSNVVNAVFFLTGKV